jgi:hypothetical protein
VVYRLIRETIERAAMIVDAHTDVLLELLVGEGDEPSFDRAASRRGGRLWALLAAETDSRWRWSPDLPSLRRGREATEFGLRHGPDDLEAERLVEGKGGIEIGDSQSWAQCSHGVMSTPLPITASFHVTTTTSAHLQPAGRENARL